ncbi:MAG: SURF1 family protein [Burkholderiaceae bacterium]|jgi:surfeit locus 1 family protein|nr:MAG: SURF1 family protein [Burkholderiaceae bacterium]
MAVTGSLGRWQLSRGAQKDRLQAELVARARLPALDAAAVTAAHSTKQIGAILQRTAVLHGEWIPDHSVYLENRTMGDDSGFYLTTPLRLAQGDGVVLVVRGWAPRDPIDRTRLPPVQTPTGTVEITGRVMDHVPATFSLGRDGPTTIRQNIDLAAFRAETRLPLAPVVVEQTGAKSDGLLRQWPALDSGSERNYGYAVQWFGMCALMGILLVWFQIGKPYLLRRNRRE